MDNLLTPCLWYDGKAREAAELYRSSFSDVEIREQSPMVLTMQIAGQDITLLDGGPQFVSNPSISFFFICETLEEIDNIWSHFEKEGNVLMPIDRYEWSGRYGWIQDKFGFSWQFSLGKIDDVGQKITPSLLFVGDQFGKGEEAIRFYTSIFGSSAVDYISKYGKDDGADLSGKVKHSLFTINGYKFMLMESNNIHDFAFNEAISMVITCKSQEEIDYYWDSLKMDGKEFECGWLKDKFGISWQVVPEILGELMNDPEKADRVSDAFLKMKKFNIEVLKNA
jgi:predicted 3-demethylubiquinone-9 3-methyltransferase (glyoxalase superfamily)